MEIHSILLKYNIEHLVFQLSDQICLESSVRLCARKDRQIFVLLSGPIDVTPLKIVSLNFPIFYLVALSLAAEGSVGDTYKAIMSSLQLHGDFDLSAWENIVEDVLGDAAVEVFIGNSAWTREKAQVLDSFRNILVSRYQAEHHPLTHPKDVNKWVSQKTAGMIPSVLDESEPFSPTTLLLLINSIYFKARWQIPFPQDRSCEDKFTNALGQGSLCFFGFVEIRPIRFFNSTHHLFCSVVMSQRNHAR